MWTLLEELDHGPEALSPGTTVTLVNNHDNLPGLGKYMEDAWSYIYPSIHIYIYPSIHTMKPVARPVVLWP